jgi:hypothetical protein
MKGSSPVPLLKDLQARWRREMTDAEILTWLQHLLKDLQARWRREGQW